MIMKTPAQNETEHTFLFIGGVANGKRYALKPNMARDGLPVKFGYIERFDVVDGPESPSVNILYHVYWPRTWRIGRHLQLIYVSENVSDQVVKKRLVELGVTPDE